MPDPNWPLCEFAITDSVELKEAYREIFERQYVNSVVRDWRDRRVRFHRLTFDHAFSEATNYRTGVGVHDIPLSLPRAKRILWIRLTLIADSVSIDVLAQLRKDGRGRMRKRRTLIVLDNRYVVVLEPVERGEFAFDFVTAFPADQAYLDKIRRGSNVVERMPPRK